MAGFLQRVNITFNVSRREVRRIFSTPLYLFCLLGAPVFMTVFFLTLMGNGLPDNLNVAVIDQDHSTNSRSIIRNIDAFQHSRVAYLCSDFTEARDLMQRGKIYGIFLIPEGFSRDLQSQRQPTISYYCNDAYYPAASLIFQDFMQMSELVGGAATQSTLRARGLDNQRTAAFLQPIIVERHALNNPWINYSVYLNNVLVPSVLMIFVFLVTVYTIGVELKDGTAREWMKMADDSIFKAIMGKLLPQTCIFFILGTIYNLVMFGLLKMPCRGGIPIMLLMTYLFILACQGFGVFLIGLITNFRFSMAISCLWGIVSISMSGFTFPVSHMQPVLKALSIFFPLRHYFQIYVCEALNGYSLYYCLDHVIFLMIFILLPLTVLYRLKGVLLTYKYEP